MSDDQHPHNLEVDREDPGIWPLLIALLITILVGFSCDGFRLKTKTKPEPKDNAKTEPDYPTYGDVWFVSPLGSRYAGGRRNSPTSYESASLRCNDGDTIILMDGSYVPPLIAPRGKRNITIAAEHKWMANLDTRLGADATFPHLEDWDPETIHRWKYWSPISMDHGIYNNRPTFWITNCIITSNVAWGIQTYNGDDTNPLLFRNMILYRGATLNQDATR